MFKKFVFLFILLVLVGFTLTAEAASKYSLKLGCEEVTGSMQHQFVTKFKEYVEKESKGEISVSIFPGQQLGDPFAVLESVQTGVVDMGVMNGGSIATVLKEYTLFSVPSLLPEDMEKNRKLFSTDFVKTLTANAEKTGLKFLGIYVEPFFNLTANRKIEKPEDFKGLKVRTMNSPIILATYRALGANPTPVPFFEVYSGLQTNLIDAQENPINIIYEMSFHEVQKYLILTNHSTTVNVLFINQKLFDGMSKNLQEIVMGGGRVAQDYMFSEVPNIEKQAIEMLKRSGKITIAESSPEIRAAYKKASEPAKEEFLKIVGEKEGQEILQALEAALKTIE